LEITPPFLAGGGDAHFPLLLFFHDVLPFPFFVFYWDRRFGSAILLYDPLIFFFLLLVVALFGFK